VALGLLTYTLVNVTWVFFRAKTSFKAWIVLRGMFGQNAAAKPILATFSLISVPRSSAGSCSRTADARAHAGVGGRTRPGGGVVHDLGVDGLCNCHRPGAGNAFIYFQF